MLGLYKTNWDDQTVIATTKKGNVTSGFNPEVKTTPFKFYSAISEHFHAMAHVPESDEKRNALRFIDGRVL